jgi:hypothetical protein
LLDNFLPTAGGQGFSFRASAPYTAPEDARHDILLHILP